MSVFSSHGFSFSGFVLIPGLFLVSVHFIPSSFCQRSSGDMQYQDDQIWALMSNFSHGKPPSSSSTSFLVGNINSKSRSGLHAYNDSPSPPLPPAALSSPVRPSGPHSGAPGRTTHLITPKVRYWHDLCLNQHNSTKVVVWCWDGLVSFFLIFLTG